MLTNVSIFFKHIYVNPDKSERHNVNYLNMSLWFVIYKINLIFVCFSPPYFSTEFPIFLSLNMWNPASGKSDQKDH